MPQSLLQSPVDLSTCCLRQVLLPVSPTSSHPSPPDNLDSMFVSGLSVPPIGPPLPSSIAGTLEIIAAPRVAPMSIPTPHTACVRLCICVWAVLAMGLGLPV
jgi:hypothetical protein